MSSRSFTLTDKLLHGCNWACTALSKIDQRSSFILPHDIGLFTVKSWRDFFSTESRENVVWGLPCHCFSMLLLSSYAVSSVTWIYPDLLICYDISKPQKINTDYNFHSRTLLADAHSKHILITMFIDSQNFRKLQEWFSEFERDENTEEKIQ